jgi:hypothetical protein
MDDSVLLFHGIGNSTCGSCAAGRKRMAKKSYGRVPVKRRRRGRGMRGVSSIGNMRGLGASASMRDTIGAVKGIVMTGAMAGAGAVISNKVWKYIAEAGGLSTTATPKWVPFANMATGIAIGLIISKLLKKPALGVAFATGAVAVGVRDVLIKYAPEMAGIPQIRQSGDFQRAIAASNFQGVPAIGPGIPSWMDVPQEANFTYAN